ncbi:UvrD-helicase domain-containing protein [archaeon]|jgi:superfamily I DNA/RNA helicase|nr:UvrD-helicase domain-containing protein [archaeon]
MVEVEVHKRDDSTDYTKILKALIEIPFPIGKKLLADFLNGNYANKSISKNVLDERPSFDSLSWSPDKISKWVDRLIQNKMIENVSADYNKFAKLLQVTLRGRNEIFRPTLNKQQEMLNTKTEITEEDKEAFEKHSEFLNGFNPEQKKAIISSAKNILCIAGAGSGKTTVLIKRIEFMIKEMGTLPSEILAITFTRKARNEMISRLKKIGIENVNVHTFNSFCETILRKHEADIYNRKTRVLSYADKILALNLAIANQGLEMDQVIDGYFSDSQKENKTGSQLANSFMNDCFSVLEHFKAKKIDPHDFSKNSNDQDNAKIIYNTISFIDEHLKVQGLRDFTDQIVDTLDFFQKSPHEIPIFPNILIDEYQDVNNSQVQLIKMLRPKNIFAVGDPRQSIFGWRGSDVKFILNFESDFPSPELIHLEKNYRSTKDIIKLMNQTITEMGLPNLSHHKEEDGEIKVMEHPSEENERIFVLGQILESQVPREEIFVLARTNKQLSQLSDLLKKHNVAHILKTDEQRTFTNAKEGEVTLATIHAIKGLEAKEVYIIGATTQNFPCRASDHPAIEMIKLESYNKDAEEKRLFYVAISRAKEKLVITYSGKKTSYLS